MIAKTLFRTYSGSIAVQCKKKAFKELSAFSVVVAVVLLCWDVADYFVNLSPESLPCFITTSR